VNQRLAAVFSSPSMTTSTTRSTFLSRRPPQSEIAFQPILISQQGTDISLHTNNYVITKLALLTNGRDSRVAAGAWPARKVQGALSSFPLSAPSCRHTACHAG
jgi:hypothetical protein